jgi:hypothetical protein
VLRSIVLAASLASRVFSDSARSDPESTKIRNRRSVIGELRC